jgi:ribosomal protein L37AE/L43A
MTRDKETVYLCPRCDHHVFAWDSSEKIWVCHWKSCTYTEKHDYDPVDQQMITLFETLRYLVAQTPPPLEAGFVRTDQQRLVDELTAIVALRKD